MKRTIFALLATAAFVAPASAATIAGLYDTGVDSNGAKLAVGSADGHFTVNGGASFVYYNGAYLNDPSAQFIAVQPDGGRVSSLNTYSLTFDLGGPSFGPFAAQISGSFAADNSAIVSLNGIPIANNTAQFNSTSAFQSLTNFSANSGFVSGSNTLSFQVADGSPPSALLVTNLTGTVLGTPGPIAGAGLVPLLGLAGAYLFGRKRLAA